MKLKSSCNLLLATALALAAGTFAPVPVASSAPPPPMLAISQIPLTVAIPAHPQVLFAIGNSQSMDGDLGGAIMTGSGALAATFASLNSSSSPVDYNVPAGFTPPVAGSPGPSVAAYTVVSAGVQYDNSASRLNVAKAGMQAIIAAYAKNTQFALADYSAGSGSLYKTWLYMMSGPGGFTFSNDNTAPPAGMKYVPNPCYQYTTASAKVQNNCTDIATLYATNVLATNQYMLIAKSSDDADVNDVLYSTSNLAAFVDYGARSKPDPYPPNFSLTNYNNGGVTIGYASAKPAGGPKVTGPTNAGFVPYSDQVFYAQRGFGYYSPAAANTGKVVVTMQSAGLAPTPASVQAVIDAFAPALAPETNQPATTEIKAVAVQSPLAGLLTKAKSYLGTVPNPGGCAKQYVILISDGLPTLDMGGKVWPPLGSASAAGYGVTATFNADGSLAATNDQALTDTIAAITALRGAGIDTYIVGLGAGVDPALNPEAAATLKAMAVAGNTSDYFPATSPADLVADLDSILISIQKGTLSATSVAVNSGSLNTDSAVYQATFTVSDTPYQDWTGDLNSYGINADGSIAATPDWSAKAKLAVQVAGTGWDTGRLIATWNPSTPDGVPFRWTDLSATQQASLAVVGDPAVAPPAPSNAELRLNYLRGDASGEQHNGGAFRDRSGFLGDIVDSNPIYVGQPLGAYLDTSYVTFKQTFATTPRPPMLYAGANDGMLHAIDPSNGAEKFAFVPDGVFANLADLASPYYNANHHFFVDGQPQANDVLFGSDGKWHTVLVGGENAGGRSVYALDITHPENLTSETALADAVLWEFSDPDMGLSFSVPTIARISANPVTDVSTAQVVDGFAVLFGNGYNSPGGQPVFYAVKPDTGAVIAKIDLCTASGVPSGACDPALPNGLSSVVVANASGILGYAIDKVYAGDLQGNLWAIDVSDADVSNWQVRLIFQARDGLGNPQPITTAPVLTLNPNYPAKQGVMAYFGTGQLLQTSDLTSTDDQSFYAVWDSGQSTPATRADLQQQTITTKSAAVTGLPQDVRTSSNNPVDWSTQQGWYYDLPLSGERVTSRAVIENGGVIFDTYTPVPPSAVQCSVGGQSWLMDVAYNNGGPFDRPELDVAGTGDLNSGGQQVGGENPTGMSLGTGYVPTPSIIRAGLPGGVGVIKAVNKTAPNGTPGVGTIKERGHGPSRAGWWQVQ